MYKSYPRKFRQRRGFVLSTELILVASALVIGLVGGLTALKTGISSEMTKVANDFHQLRQQMSHVSVVDVEHSEYSSQPKCIETIDLQP